MLSCHLLHQGEQGSLGILLIWVTILWVDNLYWVQLGSSSTGLGLAPSCVCSQLLPLQALAGRQGVCWSQMDLLTYLAVCLVGAFQFFT